MFFTLSVPIPYQVRAAADAELHTMEMHFHLARTLTRVERRTEVAKMARAWRAWGEVVRAEGEAELHALERHYHVAQTVARVVARVHERRLSRAWSLWARLAARGAAGRPVAARRVSTSLSSFPPGLLAAARNPRDTASLARVSRTNASWPVGTAVARDASAPAAGGALASSSSSHDAVIAATEREQQARRSRTVMYKAGATAVRGLFRRAEARSLSRSWQVWRVATTADAAREARGILGATRIAELFDEAQENHKAQLLHRSWAKWVAWSTAEGGRLEWEAEAASWAVAEQKEKERSIKTAAAAEALAAATGRWEGRVLRAHLGMWVRAAQFTTGSGARGDGGNGTRWQAGIAPHGPASSAATVTEDAKTPHGGDSLRATTSGAVVPSWASPASAVSLLRSKLRGETSPGLSVSVPPVPSDDPRMSTGDDAVPLPHRLMVSAPVPVPSTAGLATPTSPLVPQGFGNADGPEGNGPTPGRGRAWSDRFNYSSSLYSPPQPPAGAGGKSTSATIGRVHLQTGTPLFPGDGMEDDLSSSSSLDLTASAESVNALRSHADGGTASPPPGGATPNASAAGSPEGSLAAYMSDGSPLLGESVLVSRGGGNSDGRTGIFGAGGVSIGNGGLALVSGEDAMDGRTTAGDLPEVVYAHPGESEGRGAATSFAGKSGAVDTTRTPPESRPPRRSALAANSGGKIGANGRARFPKSPPYVGGSVEALSLGRDSPARDGEGEEGRGDADGGITHRYQYSSNAQQPNPQEEVDWEEEGEEGEEGEKGLAAGARLEMSLDSKFPSAAGGLAFPTSVRLEQEDQEAPDARIGMEFSAGGGELARAAGDFVDIMTSVLWRRAFARWAQVSRDAAFHEKEADTNLKVRCETRVQNCLCWKRERELGVFVSRWRGECEERCSNLDEGRFATSRSGIIPR